MAQKNRRLSWWTDRIESRDDVTVRILKSKSAKKPKKKQALNRKSSNENHISGATQLPVKIEPHF